MKNDNKQLPLSQEKTKKILVIGDNANRIQSYGGGSAEIKAFYEITPLLGIKMLLGGNAKVDFVPGYYADNFDHMNMETNWQTVWKMPVVSLEQMAVSRLKFWRNKTNIVRKQ